MAWLGSWGASGSWRGGSQAAECSASLWLVKRGKHLRESKRKLMLISSAWRWRWAERRCSLTGAQNCFLVNDSSVQGQWLFRSWLWTLRFSHLVQPHQANPCEIMKMHLKQPAQWLPVNTTVFCSLSCGVMPWVLTNHPSWPEARWFPGMWDCLC